MYLEVAKRDLRSSHHKKKKTKNGDFCVWWMLTRLTVANISQHITSFWGKASLSARLHFLQASYVNKSMSRLSLWLSLNSFCAETWRTWPQGVQTQGEWFSFKTVSSTPNLGFGWVRVPARGMESPSAFWLRSGRQGCQFQREHLFRNLYAVHLHLLC